MSKKRPCAWLAVSLFVLVAAWAPVAEAQLEIRLNRVESYIPKFPAKKRMNRTYRPALNQLQHQLHERMAGGENLVCSAQIFKEAHWLVNYTSEPERIERRIEDLRESLEVADQSFAARQDPKDGSFGPCYETWIWRFFSSVDPLKEIAKRGETPEVPLKIWEPVDSAEEIRGLMQDLLVSDVKSGLNRRKELNLAVTALGQLLWLDYTASVFPAELDRDALAQALSDFVDNEWQDPETGYWGAWFKTSDGIKKTNDLSMTFHILSYRGGDVPNLGGIAATTGAIRRVKYPYGWNTGGTQNNHHAYDVARIINLTWDELAPSSRSYARATLFLLGTRALALSINDRGEFDPGPYGTVGEAYYFGISFFAELGVFGNKTGRDTVARIDNADELLAQIEANLSKLDSSDSWVVAAKRKLETIKSKP
ncbi:MAG: hypothetical protein AAGD13_13205 [Pseudomonadota bacterium]